MKLSNKQRNELEILHYWIPENVTWKPITDDDIETFFKWSDKGIPHNRNVLTDKDGFTCLYWAKKYRDLQVQMYLEDWGTTMNAWSFTDMPRLVVEDIAKRMKKPAIMEKYV